MGDGKAKGKPKRPKKPKVDGAPKELDDFLDCKSMSDDRRRRRRYLSIGAASPEAAEPRSP